MTTPGPITVEIRGRLEFLPPALQRVAEVVLADPMAAAGMSISELATAAGTSPTAVVRLARACGVDGYPGLRLALASDAARVQAQRGSQAMADISEGDDLASVVAKIVSVDLAAVQDTAASLDLGVLDRVIDVLASANRLDVYGVGASAMVASDLQGKLNRIGRTCLAFSDVHVGLVSAALLRKGDAAIAISHSGTTADTLDVLLRARRTGATTIGITNAPGSPLAEAADHVLITAAHESAFRSGATASRLAQLLVIDCMFVGLAQRTFAASHLALHKTYEAVHHRLSPTRSN